MLLRFVASLPKVLGICIILPVKISLSFPTLTDAVSTTASSFLWFELCTSQRKLAISTLLFCGSVPASFERCPDLCNHPEEGVSGARRSLPVRLWQRRCTPAVSKEQPRRLPQCYRVVRATVPLIHTCRHSNLIELFSFHFCLRRSPSSLPTLMLFFDSSSPPPSASLPAGPPPQIFPDEAEQQAVHLLACSADKLPAPLPPISMVDLLEALQVCTNCCVHRQT